ncbi:MAG TPA: 6-phosphogluconolactonase [Aromatoleum sp.]|uniref:6-phosphogluconolactonase n=1 Tax=Aromatoleum sp. TaxID=2307007 RepID=UPI002B48C595|nr:6-phosphogluconolactonase [Aromatoleum sp.]HJV24734.1 6-phosphogluconolactonase [Aromatoleum sp.]
MTTTVDTMELRLPPHVGQNVFDDNATMAAALADRVAAMLRHAIGRRGQASLVVSGGRSPLPFLRSLGQRKLDWSRVTVTLADERWVPADHPDSNAGLVQANLLRGPAAEARFVPLYGGEATPVAGLAACAERLRDLPRPIDVVVLGMGEDGHFASLFPGIDGLDTLLSPGAPQLAAATPPAAPHPRITFTLPALLDARNVIVQINGPRKAAVIEQAAEQGEHLLQPIAALLRQNAAPTQVFFSPAE